MKDPDAGRARFIFALDRLISSRRANGVYMSGDWRPAERQRPWLVTPCFSLIVCLEGTGDYGLPVKGGETPIRLRPSDAIVRKQDTWIRVSPREPYWSMGIQFRSDTTRLYLTRARRVKGGAELLGRHPAEFYTPRPISTEARFVIGALEETGGRSPEDPYRRELLRLLLRSVRESLDAKPGDAGGKSRVTFRAVSDYMEEHFEEPISRDSVARALGLHPRHVSRLFTTHAGEKFGAALRRLRLERARALLADPSLSIAEVAFRSGFSSDNFFIQCFRKAYGQTPGAFRAGLKLG